jgi:hypothetical protein
MYMRQGLAAVPQDCTALSGWFMNSACWSNSIPGWQAALGVQPGSAPPPAPTGAALTVPPADAQQAAALVQQLSNQQVIAQQAADAGQVAPVTDVYSVTGDVVSNASALPSAIPWGTIALAAAGVLTIFLFMGRR